MVNHDNSPPLPAMLTIHCMKVSYCVGFHRPVSWKGLRGYNAVDVVASCLEASTGLGRWVRQGSATWDSVIFSCEAFGEVAVDCKFLWISIYIPSDQVSITLEGQ